MTQAYDRRYFGFLGLLFFLGFLGFLGTENSRHLAALSAPACFAAFSGLVFIPRSAEKIPERFRLKDPREIFRALAGRV